jgi:hypothetical protein
MMRELRILSAELKAAYDLQDAARKRQTEVRTKIIDLIGDKNEASEFLNLLRYQAEPSRLKLECVLTDCEYVGVEQARAKFKVISNG